ncbi:diguanylate cyclase [Solirubrobacter phytolaccae]|uniref:Diguanylate cyclase n=1 Tax=Solirubrobacter phytolaccae TaxID=1404360 RepID=A0A9X3N7B6_9ACTN|nr:diguanylate cyclase [Solirubrobacter phytolaccae]MDA0180811.1 diguanylate cyclase [Solirubrobacter phytolaccae]
MPVALQLWELSRGILTRSWASEEARRRIDLPCEADALAAACQAQEPMVLEWPGDRERWWRVQIIPLGGTSVLAALEDITARRAHLRSLRASEQLNGEILSRLQEGVVVIDMEACVVVVNDAAAALFGVTVEELADRPLDGVPVDLLDERGHLLTDEQLPLTRALRGEEVSDQVVRFVRRDGSLLWVEIHANPLRDEHGEQYGAVASYDDVTERVEQNRRTRHEADHDALTGLANRRALERTLEAALGRAGARSRAVGVVMLDLDGFKAINDTRGHAAGDLALREVAARLRRCVRERDLVARLGGDEFVVVLTDLERAGAVAEAVERVREALVPAFEEMELGAAIGVALYPSDGGTAEDLLAHADRAMYVDKGARNGSLR